MKLKLTALVVGAFLTTMFSTTAYADDFDRHQMNYQVNFADDWHVRYRSYTEGLNGDWGKDKSHFQIGTKVWDGKIKLQYQYWDNNGQVEHRPRFDIVGLKWRGFSIGKRFEFRHQEGKDEYIRPWIQLGYQYKWNDNKIKISVNPRFALGKDGVDDGDLENILTIFEYERKIGRFAIAPGFWYQVDDNLDKKSLYTTLAFKYKF